MYFGRACNVEFHFAEQFIVVIDERDIDFNALTHTGIGKMLDHAISIRFVGQLLAYLRQIVLAIGILDVD